MCALPSLALAQGVVKAQYGDWQMSCDTPPGASFEQCAIIQNVTAEDQPNVGLSVIVLKTADQRRACCGFWRRSACCCPTGSGSISTAPIWGAWRSCAACPMAASPKW